MISEMYQREDEPKKRSVDGFARIVESCRDAEVHVLSSTKSRWLFRHSFLRILERKASLVGASEKRTSETVFSGPVVRIAECRRDRYKIARGARYHTLPRQSTIDSIQDIPVPNISIIIGTSL